MRNKFVWTHQRHKQKNKSIIIKTKTLKCKLWGLNLGPQGEKRYALPTGLDKFCAYSFPTKLLKHNQARRQDLWRRARCHVGATTSKCASVARTSAP
jgi:hypothetical protein